MFNNKLKILRERYGLTQHELADILNIKRSQYSDYEREYKIIPIKHLNNLAKYYNVSIDYLFCFNENKTYYNSKDIDKNISGCRLKELRKGHGVTQNKLANIINTSNTVISGYEIGRRLIATPFLYDICKKYNISADYLLGKVDEPKYLK